MTVCNFTWVTAPDPCKKDNVLEITGRNGDITPAIFLVPSHCLLYYWYKIKCSHNDCVSPTRPLGNFRVDIEFCGLYVLNFIITFPNNY